ncbi:jg136, partial [Pararge aegeria aegeria]
MPRDTNLCGVVLLVVLQSLIKTSEEIVEA